MTNPIERALERADATIEFDRDLDARYQRTLARQAAADERGPRQTLAEWIDGKAQPAIVTLVEDVDYTHTGWRPGEAAFIDAPPEVTRLNRPEIDREFATWHDHVQAVAKLRRDLAGAYEDTLSSEQKLERAAESERRMFAEADEFYRTRPAGSNRSFWD